MIEFMVLSAPRSASTWVANWLTTDETLCLHDPLWKYHYSELDAIQSSKRLGLADTGLAKFPDFVNAHPARKVILHRDLEECSDSLVALGFGRLKHWEGVLDKIEGLHVQWSDVFVSARAQEIYEHLLPGPFDMERHDALCKFHVQPNFSAIMPDAAMRETAQRLLKELRG